MIIDAMVDRFENGNTYFVLGDVNAEISIPKSDRLSNLEIGETVQLTISDSGKVIDVIQ